MKKEKSVKGDVKMAKTKQTKSMKLSEIGAILFECKQELRTLGDAVEDNGNTKWLKGIDDLYMRVTKARQAIENKNVVID